MSRGRVGIVDVGSNTTTLALFRAAVEIEDGEGERGATTVSLDLERLERASAAQRVLAGHTGPIFRMAVFPDGKRLVTGAADGTARIWDVATGGPLSVLAGHGHVVQALAVSADGKLVDVQARVGARWRTFATVRTGRRGRVRHRHRFAPSSSGRTYRFRVLARKETAYPYESGASEAVAVRVL